MSEYFKVKVYIEHRVMYLSVTHNGKQWTSLSIKNPEQEIPLIITELEKQLIEMDVKD